MAVWIVLPVQALVDTFYLKPVFSNGSGFYRNIHFLKSIAEEDSRRKGEGNSDFIKIVIYGKR